MLATLYMRQVSGFPIKDGLNKHFEDKIVSLRQTNKEANLQL